VNGNDRALACLCLCLVKCARFLFLMTPDDVCLSDSDSLRLDD